MHTHKRWPFGLLLFAVSFVGGPRLAAETARHAPVGALNVSVEEVFAAWDARAEQIRSFAATWQQSEFYRRNSLPGREAPRPKTGQAQATPAQDTTVEMQCELRLSGERFWVRRTGPQWQSDLNEFVDGEQVAALDDEHATFLSQTVLPVAEPRAHVAPAGRMRESRSVANLPLFLALRPRSQAVGPIEREGVWSVAPMTAEIEGHVCAIVERLTSVYHPDLAKGELRETYWVDPTHDFCVRRYERTLGGAVELQVEIDYADPTHAWLPTRWKSTAFGGVDAVSTRQYEARLLTHAVNAALPAERLRIELPEGAAVEDIATREAWIVRPNGERRIVTQEERARGASYAQLLATEPGQAALQAWQPWRTATGLAAFALAAFAVASRWRRARPSLVCADGLPSAPATAPWLPILLLASAMLLGGLATGLTAAPITCAGRCQSGVWSAYKQGSTYRMDFLLSCTYRAWSNDVNVAYAPSNSCAKGYVQIPYYLFSTTISHPCFLYAPTGDLLWTYNGGGTYLGYYTFPCCDGQCYGVN